MTPHLRAGRTLALIALALTLGLLWPLPAEAKPLVCFAGEEGPVCYFSCAELLKAGEWMLWMAVCAPF